MQTMTTATSEQLKYNPILKYFAYNHLRPDLQEVSVRFHDLAMWIVGNIPNSGERTVALRKLLEGKDAAVRAMLE